MSPHFALHNRRCNYKQEKKKYYERISQNYSTSNFMNHIRFCSIISSFLPSKESYNYRDPITELVECLYVNFDFDGAQVKLRECDQVIDLFFFFNFIK